MDRAASESEPIVIHFTHGVVTVGGVELRVNTATLTVAIEHAVDLIESLGKTLSDLRPEIPMPEPNFRRGAFNDAMPHFFGRPHQDRRNALKGHPRRRKPDHRRNRPNPTRTKV